MQRKMVALLGGLLEMGCWRWSWTQVVPASVKCIHDDWQIGIWRPEIMGVGMGVR